MRNILKSRGKALVLAAAAVAGLATSTVAPAQAGPVGDIIASLAPPVNAATRLTACDRVRLPYECYLLSTGTPAQLRIVGAGPITCPIWYWDGAVFRPRAVQQGCVTTAGSYDFDVYPHVKFFPISVFGEFRNTPQGLYRRLLSKTYLVGDDRVLKPYAADTNTWVKVGDPRPVR